MAGDLLGETFAERAQTGPSRPVEIARLDVVGQRRLRRSRWAVVPGRPRRPVVALGARVSTALRARVSTALRPGRPIYRGRLPASLLWAAATSFRTT
ncbi:MAG TPA: hypothetical protein VHC43_12845 [Mycobacteriales bacterium]|nr:hypothetical protein [Mycobacteriales bacterium]